MAEETLTLDNLVIEELKERSNSHLNDLKEELRLVHMMIATQEMQVVELQDVAANQVRCNSQALLSSHLTL